MQLLISILDSDRDESKAIEACFDKLFRLRFGEDEKDQTSQRVRQNSNHKPVIYVHLSNAKKNIKLAVKLENKKKEVEKEGEKMFVEWSERAVAINDFS